jgi:hypothetical protein
MNKALSRIETSKSNFFIFADELYEALKRELHDTARSISSKPKLWFRCAFLVVAACLCLGLVNCLTHVGQDIYMRQEYKGFAERHSDMFADYLLKNPSKTHSLEEQGIFHEMVKCMNGKVVPWYMEAYRSEQICAADLVSRVATENGQERALAVRNLLVKMNFQLPEWMAVSQ